MTSGNGMVVVMVLVVVIRLGHPRQSHIADLTRNPQNGLPVKPMLFNTMIIIGCAQSPRKTCRFAN